MIPPDIYYFLSLRFFFFARGAAFFPGRRFSVSIKLFCGAPFHNFSRL